MRFDHRLAELTYNTTAVLCCCRRRLLFIYLRVYLLIPVATLCFYERFVQCKGAVIWHVCAAFVIIFMTAIVQSDSSVKRYFLMIVHLINCIFQWCRFRLHIIKGRRGRMLNRLRFKYN